MEGWNVYCPTSNGQGNFQMWYTSFYKKEYTNTTKSIF